MTGSQWLTIAGLTLTLTGAAILATRDLRRAWAGRGKRRSTMADIEYGIRRPETWLAFPLIAIGSALQIAGVAASSQSPDNRIDASVWEQLTAVGTLALAIVTTTLVAATYLLVRESRSSTRAQWRPVVLVRQWAKPESTDPDEMHGVTWDGYRIDAMIQNVGRGPALEVVGTLTGVPGTSPTALAPGETTWLRWEDAPGGDEFNGTIRYRDLAGTDLMTSFVLKFRQSPVGWVKDQRVVGGL